MGGVSSGSLGMNTSFNVGDSESHVRGNRSRFFAALGITPDRIVFPRQVHGKIVRLVDEPGTIDHCDGLITRVKGLYLSVSVADCFPIIIFDRKTESLAALHAGWRGSCAGVIPSALEMLENACNVDPADLLCFIGPGARSCCYEVGEDVAQRFGSDFVNRASDGTCRLDLASYNRSLLLGRGVRKESIEVSENCTICTPELLHSFRRDGANSGRMMAIAGMCR
ncbi:MAG TPA: peptidoglycan editing factor PgeF [Bacteroidota bacterium]|nr:peptidoglycan editing factor PgeF [Bacteroidota bacterium]